MGRNIMAVLVVGAADRDDRHNIHGAFPAFHRARPGRQPEAETALMTSAAETTHVHDAAGASAGDVPPVIEVRDLTVVYETPGGLRVPSTLSARVRQVPR